MSDKQQVPSVGRVVHYVVGNEQANAHCAAIITHAAYQSAPDAEPMQTLVVFQSMGTPYGVAARYDANGAPGTWHWPEYVPAR